MALEAVPWNLTIASDLRLLAVVRAFVEGVCRVGDFEESFIDSVVLATDEATNNVMRHAHQGNVEAIIEVQCRLLPDGIEIRLVDEGAPFDLAAVPHMDPGDLRVGGRGVYLMRQLMDEVTCQPRGRRGNTLRMLKRSRPGSSENAK